MEYVKIHNGQVAEFPYDIGQFRAENPTIAMRWPPAAIGLAAHGIFEVEVPEPPALSADQVAQPATSPELIDGLWTLPWVVRDRTNEEIAALEAHLLDQIDREAGAFRQRFITSVPGQAQTYVEKEREALAYQSDPEGSYPFLTAEAVATGSTVAAVAALVAGTAAAWRQLGAAIEGRRMGAKQAVKSATTWAGKHDAAQIDWEGLLP